MAFDGFTTAALVRELNDRLEGGRVYRIIQPGRDTLLVTIKPMVTKGGGQVRLVLSADPSLPLCYLTEENRLAPEAAPAFCMLLRKHLQNGRITRVTQPGLERIIEIDIEHMNEMGDLETHALVIELMGKHSNILLLSPENIVSSPVGSIEDGTARTVTGPAIVDAIRRVSGMVSSVREVLPGRAYFIPETKGKHDPLEETKEGFLAGLRAQGLPAARYLVTNYIGYSTILSEEIAARARLTQDRSVQELSAEEQEAFWEAFTGAADVVRTGAFRPTVYYRKGAGDAAARSAEPVEYSALPLSIYSDCEARSYDSMSALLQAYYKDKSVAADIRQRSADLRKIASTILERDVHKLDQQLRQMRDTDKRDKYRVYGELLNAYGYSIPEGASSAELDNYYTGEKLTVPLDPTKSASENAVRYFARYTKLKRTREALETLTQEVQAEIDQLESIRTALDLAQTQGDLQQIRREMQDAGFIRAHMDKSRGKKGIRRIPEAQPLHYISSDGYDIYVGKNNTQNDMLTFHMADGRDIWFHANDIPGSHVILRTGGKAMEDIPDRAFVEAAQLAAYYSKGRSAGRVEVDYLERRNVKKPSGARPGFVVYYTNYSINVDAVTGGLALADDVQSTQ